MVLQLLLKINATLTITKNHTRKNDSANVWETKAVTFTFQVNKVKVHTNHVCITNCVTTSDTFVWMLVTIHGLCCVYFSTDNFLFVALHVSLLFKTQNRTIHKGVVWTWKQYRDCLVGLEQLLKRTICVCRTSKCAFARWALTYQRNVINVLETDLNLTQIENDSRKKWWNRYTKVSIDSSTGMLKTLICCDLEKRGKS